MRKTSSIKSLAEDLHFTFAERAGGEAPPSVTLDIEAYMPLLETCDADEKTKAEMIEALWTVIVAFVDLGFGVHPLQQLGIEDKTLEEKAGHQMAEEI